MPSVIRFSPPKYGNIIGLSYKKQYSIANNIDSGASLPVFKNVPGHLFGG